MENVNNEVTSTDIKFFFNGVKIICYCSNRKKTIFFGEKGLSQLH